MSIRPGDPGINRILPFLPPEPAAVMINRTTTAGGDTVTGITFIWRGDDGDRCRRCPAAECGLVQLGEWAVCNLAVPDFVSDQSAPRFGLTRWREEAMG